MKGPLNRGVPILNGMAHWDTPPPSGPSNSEFETLGSTNRLSQSDLDRLSQLRFNPFQTNQNIALSGNNIELDTWFNTNSICCDYFLPKDFRTQNETKNIAKKFSLLHLNIRSISN